jgi:hypothetical protein
MKPSMEQLQTKLKELGFELHPHVPHFGSELRGVYYVCRKTGKLHEYVSLMSYEGEFCEGHYEFFYAPKNTYLPKGRTKTSELVKKGFRDLLGALFRSEADMLSLVVSTPEERTTRADKALKELEKQKD